MIVEITEDELDISTEESKIPLPWKSIGVSVVVMQKLLLLCEDLGEN